MRALDQGDAEGHQGGQQTDDDATGHDPGRRGEHEQLQGDDTDRGSDHPGDGAPVHPTADRSGDRRLPQAQGSTSAVPSATAAASVRAVLQRRHLLLVLRLCQRFEAVAQRISRWVSIG